jgi:hypothetical protein
MSLSRILADVTVVKPVASVLLEVPGAAGNVLTTSTVATTVIQVPLAAISYFNIVVSAEVDFRGLNQIVHEFKVVIDQSALHLFKNVFDSNATADSQQILFFKKGSTDVTHTSEVRTFSLQRTISESLHSQDDFNASVPTDDGEVMTFGKHVPDDAVTKSDVEHMAFGKGLVEAKSALDVRTTSLSKTKSDAVSNVDANTIDLSKLVEDSVDAGDEMNAQAITDDGEVMIFGKTIPDGFTNTDEASVETGKSVASSNAMAGDELLPFELGKGITDTPVTSETRSVDIVRGAIEDFPVTWDYAIVDLPKRLYDFGYQSEGPNQYDTYSLSYFAEDYVRQGFPAITFSKSLTDMVISTDDFYGAANADDDETMQFAKVLIESATSADTKAYTLGKDLTDTATRTDVANISASKVASDAVSKSDAASKNSGKTLSDQFSSSDSKTIVIGKGLTDSAQTQETQAFAISKQLSDVVDATDDFFGVANADDDETMLLNKATSDTFTKSDVTVVTAGKGLTDSVSKSDSGSLVWTDYWDINYTVTTSGVYVGNSQTF